MLSLVFKLHRHIVRYHIYTYLRCRCGEYERRIKGTAI